MKISNSQWKNYQTKMSSLSEKAKSEMKSWITKQGGYTNVEFEDAIRQAYSIATKYGEATASLSALMYDTIAEKSGANVAPAEVADTVSLDEVKKTIYGASTYSQNDDYIAGTVGRMAKQAGADTTVQNAKRDGAEFAWINTGDSCAFCQLLSSMGWQHASAKTIKGDHAEHIHANCTCQFMIRFDKETTVEGYNPNTELYNETPGKTLEEKASNLRRMETEGELPRQNEAKEDYNSEKMKKSLGSMYDDYAKKVSESGLGGLFNEFSENLDVKQTKDQGFYRPSTKQLCYNISDREGLSEYNVLSHESGHALDYYLGRVDGLSYNEVDAVNEACKMGRFIDPIQPLASNSDEFLSALRNDAENLKASVRDNSIKDLLLSDNVTRNATKGVQDMLDGFYSTQKNGTLPIGHGDTYYNRFYNNKIKSFKNEKDLQQVYKDLGLDASNQAKTKRISRSYEASSEAWANITSAVVDGGEELENVKKYMPEAYEVFMNIVKEAN